MSLPRPSYSAVTATLALVVALGAGSAVAADKITGRQIAKNTVTGKNLKDGTVAPADLAPAAQPSAGPRGPQGLQGLQGLQGTTMPFDYDSTFTNGFSFGASVPNGTCVGSSSSSLTPRAGTDGTIADDLVFVTLKTSLSGGIFVTGKPQGTNQVTVTICNFSGATADLSSISLRIATVDPN
jgi:hypothetical protein